MLNFAKVDNFNLPFQSLKNKQTNKQKQYKNLTQDKVLLIEFYFEMNKIKIMHLNL